MGIDIHIGNHYIGFHVPTLALWLVGLVAVYGVVKFGRYVLAATGVWSN